MIMQQLINRIKKFSSSRVSNTQTTENVRNQAASGKECELVCHLKQGIKFPESFVKELILLSPWTVAHTKPSFTFSEQENGLPKVNIRFKSINPLASKALEETIYKHLTGLKAS